VGMQGELVAPGPTLMRGYWGLPERTAQSWVEHRLISELGTEQIYQTGDRVEVGAGDLFYFLGRLDNMIKSRGYRIELGDIETALYNHTDIAEVAILAVPDEEISHRLVAMIVQQKEAELTVRQVKAFVGTLLPKYMIPDEVHFVGQFPQTSTGKVDRQKLLTKIVNI